MNAEHTAQVNTCYSRNENEIEQSQKKSEVNLLRIMTTHIGFTVRVEILSRVIIHLLGYVILTHEICRQK